MDSVVDFCAAPFDKSFVNAPPFPFILPAGARFFFSSAAAPKPFFFSLFLIKTTRAAFSWRCPLQD